MTRPEDQRGVPLNRQDQVTIIAVAVAILVLTGFLVGLLF